MGLISTLIAGVRGLRAGEANPNDERWWASGTVFPTATGLHVTPELAGRVSAVFRAVVILANLSTLPLHTFRDRDRKGKERLRNHPVGSRIATKGLPNAWQTGEEWRHVMAARAVLWGGGASEVTYSAGGGLLGLLPLEPDWLELEQLNSGRIRGIYREPGKSERSIPQERLVRLSGPGWHANLNPGVLALARESIGLWLAMEKFGGLYFSQGARPSLAVKVKGKLQGEAREKAREEFQQLAAGWRNHWRPLLLENDAQLESFGFNARDSQLVEAREAQIYDLATWSGIAPRLLGARRVQPASSAEQEATELVEYALRPLAVRFEAVIQRDLIAEDDVFVEHVFEGLLRGNTRDRFDAYGVAIMNGFMSENEVRLRENLNPVDGLWEPRRSVNQDRGAEPRRSEGRSRPPARPPREEPEDEDDDRATVQRATAPARRLVLIAEAAARRVVGREKAALRDHGSKLARKREAWSTWLADFYGETLPAVVAETLQLEPAVVRGYCDRRRAAVENGLLTANDGAWEADAIRELVELATKENAHAA